MTRGEVAVEVACQGESYQSELDRLASESVTLELMSVGRGSSDRVTNHNGESHGVLANNVAYVSVWLCLMCSDYSGRDASHM